MRIAVATTNFPSRTFPQKGVFLARDAGELAARGHAVTCLVARSRLRDPCGEAVRLPGVEVRETSYLSLGYVRPFHRILNPLTQRNSDRALGTLLGTLEGPPVEVVYAKFLNAGPVLLRAPDGAGRVLGVGEGVGSIGNRLEFVGERRLEECVRAADVVEVKNEQVRRWFSERYDCAGRIRVVPSGVDTDFFRPADRRRAREALGLPPDAFIVASVGPRNRNKGGERVVAACAALEGAGALPVMVGPGWEPEEGAPWRGLGLVDPATVRTVLQAADAFALPSLSEGMPNAVLEALACGLPCVVSDRPFTAFVEDRRSCLKADPDSVEALAAALTELAGSPDLRARMGRAARARAEELGQHRRVDALEGLLREAVERRREG